MEHEAFRERVGIIDMTSFGKIEVSGPGALALLERVADNRIDRPVGSVVYTQFLNDRGGIVADVTVTRLEDSRFRVVTGAGTIDSDLGWLRLNLREEDGAVELRDVSEELAVIGLWGPRARDVLAGVTEDDVGGEALPFRAARTIRIGGAEVLAQRITYVGELGFELYVAPDWAVQVWDRLLAAGEPHGIEPGGYRVLDSLRLEKGYRYFGTDLTARGHPLRGGARLLRRAREGRVQRSRARSRRRASGRPDGSARCSSEARSTCRSTAARRCARAVRSSAGFGARATGSRSPAPSGWRICPRRSRPARSSRSRCSGSRWAPSWPRTRSSIRRTIGFLA